MGQKKAERKVRPGCVYRCVCSIADIAGLSDWDNRNPHLRKYSTYQHFHVYIYLTLFFALDFDAEWHKFTWQTILISRNVFPEQNIDNT